MEDEKKEIDKALERHLPEIQETIRKDQKRMRREDEEFLREQKKRAGDSRPVQRPWFEKLKDRKRREARAAKRREGWDKKERAGWGTWEAKETDGWSTRANYKPGAGESSKGKPVPTEEEWKSWGGKANADADWWNGHYDDEF